MATTFRGSEVLRGIAVGVLVMVHGMSALPKPFPSKGSNTEKKYSLTFKDGLSYANYAGAVLSAAAIVENIDPDYGYRPFIPLFIAGAALNILSAKVDPEKNPKSNIALSAANIIWGLGHIGLIGFCCGELMSDPIVIIYWGIKGAINIANVVYRTSVASKKK